LLLLVDAAAMFGAVVFLPSRLALEKLVTSLVMPVGMVWLGLTLAVAIAVLGRLRLLTVLLIACWCLLTLAGNGWVAQALLMTLEGDYRAIDSLAVVDAAEPLDAIVTLGGATNLTPAGQTQLVGAGDRVMLAARLYHASATRQLVANGLAMADEGDEGSNPADETYDLWRSVGIPDEAILRLAGRNTREEMAAIAAAAEEHGWQRIGLVTSASHMARAERLGRAVGLEFVPLPANFMSEPPNVHLISPVPSFDSLAKTSIAAKELLAGLVGR
jgi:uncharacterized SAM-binding protein YcdF (DUF218 family)